MKKIVLLTAVSVLSAASAHAHFLFIELPGGSPTVAHLRFAEEPGEETNTKMQEKAKPMRVLNQDSDEVAFEIGDGALTATVAEDTTWLNGSFAYGVLDRNSEGKGTFLLNYYAKSVRTPADAGAKVGTGLEVVAEWKDDTVVATVLLDGTPAADAEILLDSSTADETVEKVTDDAGQAIFPAPAPGWIGLRALVVEDSIGEVDGEAYGSIRSYATLTVEVTE